jgi:DNA polymerase III delta prime subunit
MNLLLHPLTKKRYETYITNPPQSLILVAPAGSGKETVLKQLALDILGEHPAGRLFEILPDIGKKTIGIDAIRELKMTLRLKSDKARVVLINQANSMTTEAQNSILKLLEDTPKNVHFLIGINNQTELLDTINSRSVMWQFIAPTKKQIENYFTTYSPAKLAKAIAIAENRVGLISALLNEDQNHPLLQAIETAKEILSENHFGRLVRVEAMYKDSSQTMLVLEALQLICKGALDNAALKGSTHIQEWQKRLKCVSEAIELINTNIQPKLVLSKTFVMI